MNPIDIPSQEFSFLAFIDILGFKNLILNNQYLSEFIKIYKNIFTPLQKEIQLLGIRHTLFSDSLIIGVKNRPEHEQLKSLVSFSKALLIRSISNKLPIRGAISYGTIHWDGDIVIGRPIIEAVEHEGMQDWIGILFAPSSVNYLFNNKEILNFFLKNNFIFKHNEIPVKNGNTISGYAINFLPNNSETKEHIYKSLEEMKTLSCSNSTNRKYAETEKYLAKIENRMSELANKKDTEVARRKRRSHIAFRLRSRRLSQTR